MTENTVSKEQARIGERTQRHEGGNLILTVESRLEKEIGELGLVATVVLF